jgi:hypothetical protein
VRADPPKNVSKHRENYIEKMHGRDKPGQALER